MSAAPPPPALLLPISPPQQAPPAVRCVGPGHAEPAASLEPLVHALERRCEARGRALAQALPRVQRMWAVPTPLDPHTPGVPELEAVVAWYQAHALPLREIDPALGRLADEFLTLRTLVRDAEHTARCLAPGGEPNHALVLAWIADRAGELEAVISYTDRPALSFVRGRVPYVYNVWSSVPGRGGALLRFVAWQTGSRRITLHPLHEAVAAHYVRSYGADPAR